MTRGSVLRRALQRLPIENFQKNLVRYKVVGVTMALVTKVTSNKIICLVNLAMRQYLLRELGWVIKFLTIEAIYFMTHPILNLHLHNYLILKAKNNE